MISADLNLLSVFDTLYELRSVTRTAERMGLTQSAVSHALGRLRRMLDDPLFLRNPAGLLPTARADDIAPVVRESLTKLRAAISPSADLVSHAARRFTIAAGAYFCTLFIPALVEHARRAAPGVSFRIVPLGDSILSMLDRTRADLAFGSFSRVSNRFVLETLYAEEMVWVAAATSPLAGSAVTERTLAACPRVAIVTTIMQDSTGAETDLRPFASTFNDPAAGGEAMAVYDSSTAIAIVARTNMIAFVPRRMAQREQASGRIVILDTNTAPFAAPLSMLWHTRHREDRGHLWLRTLIHGMIKRPPVPGLPAE